MDSEALPQRAAGSRRNAPRDVSPSGGAKEVPLETQSFRTDAAPGHQQQSDLPEYRTNAEQNQRFECEDAQSQASMPPLLV